MARPKLRFKGFNKEWENVSLLSCSELITKGTTQKAFIGGNVNYLKIEAIKDGLFDLDKCQTISQEIHRGELKRSILKNNDLLFAIAGATIGKNAKVKENILPANTNQALAIIRLNSSVDINFVYYVINSDVMTKYINDNVVTGAQPNMNLKQLGDFTFAIPDSEEQTKIANFLTAVDGKISQLNEQHQLMIQYKKGVMQKIFNQEIRFKDDNGEEFGEWEEKKLSDIANFRRGSFPQPYGLAKWLDPNGMPFVQVFDVSDNLKLKNFTKIKISKLAQEKSVFVKKGTLIITIQGTIGRVAKMQYDAYVDRTLLIFQSYKIDVNIDFIKYALFLLFELEKEKADGGVIKTITKETLSSFTLQLPSIKEQAQIANFLDVLEEKINNIFEQLQTVKQWKKGLLQQMLV